MSKLVNDFLRCRESWNGYGYFEGDYKAVSYSQKVTAAQRHKWVHRRLVPAALFAYMVEVGAIEKCFINEKERTVSKLLDLLYYTPERNRSSASRGEVFRMILLKELLPKVLMGSSEHLVDKGRTYR